MKKKIIYGCDGRGDAHEPYLTRYTLIDTKRFQACLHIFYRSDFTDHHDHPWPFVSIILWRGYLEETEHDGQLKRTRVWPGMVLFRKATHRHRVVLVDEKKAISLVFMGRKIRTWGFFTAGGWKSWPRYFKDNGC